MTAIKGQIENGRFFQVLIQKDADQHNKSPRFHAPEDHRQSIVFRSKASAEAFVLNSLGEGATLKDLPLNNLSIVDIHPSQSGWIIREDDGSFRHMNYQARAYHNNDRESFPIDFIDDEIVVRS